MDHERAAVGRSGRRHRDHRIRLDGRGARRLALAECPRRLDRAHPLALAPDVTRELPAWRQGDLPHPPASSVRNAVYVIGPGTILLGLSLGAGDWLLGPAVLVSHGPTLLWVCTLSVILQAL